MPREIEIQWTTVNGPGKVSVLYFDTGTAVAAQRQAIDDAMAGVVGALDSGTTYTVATAGREWDNATGALTGAWTDSTPQTGTGTVGGEPVADSTQLLVRWETGTIVNGRFLSGRTFIPGVARINQVDGNVESAIRAALETAFQGLPDDNVGFQVWHRPISGSGGSVALVGTANVWEEWAVLRRRRG